MNYQWQSKAFAELSLDELYAILRLRQQVFAIEQNCVYLDVDGLDQGAIHMLCRQDDQLLAYQRCLPPGLSYPQSALGRIVTAPAARGLQLGKKLVLRGINHNLQRWPKSDIRINAQAYLRGFYTDLGFAEQGEEYDEDGIPHLQMLYQNGWRAQR
jgi:ElaA protein